MTVYVAAAAVCIALVVALVWLLRTRRVREKYAAVWIVLTVAVVVLGAFPGLAFWLSHLVGVQTPVNLVFAVGIVVLLAVCVQLSTEVSALEDEVRTLAEEVALLRLDLEQRTAPDRAAAPEPTPSTDDRPDAEDGPSA